MKTRPFGSGDVPCPQTYGQVDRQIDQLTVTLRNLAKASKKPDEEERVHFHAKKYFKFFILFYFTNLACVAKNDLLTYSRSSVLLEKLTGSAASQEIPRFFGTRMFTTVLTSARHLSLS